MGFLQDIAVPETEVLLCWKENKRKQQKKNSPLNFASELVCITDQSPKD